MCVIADRASILTGRKPNANVDQAKRRWQAIDVASVKDRNYQRQWAGDARCVNSTFIMTGSKTFALNVHTGRGPLQTTYYANAGLVAKVYRTEMV